MATTGAASAAKIVQTPVTTDDKGKVVDSALSKIDIDQFIKLMIAELQNQDPLNPMDNEKMLGQLSQMRAIGATDRMSSTLDSVLLGQNLTNASSLIGKKIAGLDNDKQRVTGVVDKVTIVNGVPSVHLGEKTVGLKNISDILPNDA